MIIALALACILPAAAQNVPPNEVASVSFSSAATTNLVSTAPVPVPFLTMFRHHWTYPEWPAGVDVEETVVQGLGNQPGGGDHGTRTHVSSPFGHDGVYRIGLLVDTFQVRPDFAGTSWEYNGELSRQLYHVTVKGRLGTAPPDAKYPGNLNGKKQSDQIRPAYHVAGGEVLFSLYGLTLGPEEPEKSAAIWEGEGPAPSPDVFDRTWVTRFRMTYNNTNVHIQQPSTILVVVENDWQFEGRETWRDRSSLAFQVGLDHYNRVLANNQTAVFLHNVQYYGQKVAIFGWPNNFGSIDAWQKFGNEWRLRGDFTRLNLLNNQLVFLWSSDLEWQPTPHWKVAPGFYYVRRRATSVRRGLSLDLSYAW